jgi:hypothetical protein
MLISTLNLNADGSLLKTNQFYVIGLRIWGLESDEILHWVKRVCKVSRRNSGRARWVEKWVAKFVDNLLGNKIKDSLG